MNSNLRFSLGKGPFIRKADSGINTITIMRDFIIALIPLILFAWVKNGIIPMINGDCGTWDMLYPLVFCILGGVFTFLVEYIYYFFTKKEIKFTKDSFKETLDKVMNSFAIIPGLILAMIMPLNTPIWVLLTSCIVASVIGKLLFGGFGCNIFNPALVGYLFFGATYMGLTSFMNPSEIGTIISSATPLGNAHNNLMASGSELIAPYGTIWDFLLGTIPGSIAETSAILCILSFAWLTHRKVINWKIPVVYVGGVFVLTYITAIVDGRPLDLLYPLFHVLSGGLLFGAVFMATEPVTSPKTPNGKIIYALGLAVLTFLIRFKSNSAEGVATSIMAMNLFSQIIDRLASRVRAQKNLKKTLITYVSVGLILGLLSIYPIASATANKVTVSQNFSENNINEVFKYNIRIERYEIEAYTNPDGKISFISDEKYTKEVEEIISQNIKLGYISKLQKNDDKYLVSVNYLSDQSRNRRFTLHCEFDYNYKMINCYVIPYTQGGDYGEGYLYNSEYKGPIVEDVLPKEILKNQNNLEDIKVISMATTTSHAFIESARIAMNYMKNVKSGKIEFNDGYGVGVSGVSSVQNFATTDPNQVIKYTLSIDGKTIEVITDRFGKIYNISNENYRKNAEELISKNPHLGYISKLEKTNDKYLVNINYLSDVSRLRVFTLYCEFNFDFTMTKCYILPLSEGGDYGEGYLYNKDYTGPIVEDILPNQIIENQNDLSKVEIISMATTTSKAFVESARLAIDYINDVKDHIIEFTNMEVK